MSAWQPVFRHLAWGAVPTGTGGAALTAFAPLDRKQPQAGRGFGRRQTGPGPVVAGLRACARPDRVAQALPMGHPCANPAGWVLVS